MFAESWRASAFTSAVRAEQGESNQQDDSGKALERGRRPVRQMPTEFQRLAGVNFDRHDQKDVASIDALRKLDGCRR